MSPLQDISYIESSPFTPVEPSVYLNKLAEIFGGLRWQVRRALLLPPDATRAFSGMGEITAQCVRMLRSFCQVDVMPALGTHTRMTADECRRMFGDAVNPDELIWHDWRNDTVRLGDIPGEYVRKVTGGLSSQPIPVEVNRLLTDPSYDMILSLGQVVPHEVAGMANYSKNIFVGCGGAAMIHATHLTSAAWGIEKVLGEADTPTRKLYDWAHEHCLKDMPLVFLMTVNAMSEGANKVFGFYFGQGRELFTAAAELSAQVNIHWLNQPLKRVVTFMDPEEYKTTWVANKAVYRTRMAIATGGELIVLAPGVTHFGEDPEVDGVIRRHGYRGSREIFSRMKTAPDLQANPSAAAHLMQGSSDGRFAITYAVEAIPTDEIEGVGYSAVEYGAAVKKLFPGGLDKGALPGDGFHTDANGEAFYFIAHPAAGLWKAR